MKGKFGITKMRTLLLQKKAITDFSWERAFENLSADEKVSLFIKLLKTYSQTIFLMRSLQQMTETHHGLTKI